MIEGALLVTARAAYEADDWAAARAGFVAARAEVDLGGPDWFRLARSAWWLGRIEECLDAFEHSYAAFLADGAPAQAAMSALYLSLHAAQRGDDVRSNGWLARFRRLLKALPIGGAHGYGLYHDTFAAMGSGDLDTAMAMAQQMEAIGRDVADPTLVALGILAQGRILIKRGETAAGLALLDDAMLAATGVELDPVWGGGIYCHLMDVCRELVDPRRAADWTRVATTSFARLPRTNMYPGICRVHRAQVLQFQGDWVQAEREADQACADMAEVHLVTAAEAHYEVGEIRRMRGDLAGAETAYRQAHLLGRQPEPGLSLLRLAQGRTEDAQASIQTVVAGQSEPLSRAQVRVAQVEIALAAADHDCAQEAAADLAEVAAAFASPGLQAAGDHARGAVLLAAGDPAAASALEAACRRWLELGGIYEAARTRVLLAQAHLATGNTDRAELERQAAEAVFTVLGAGPDLGRVQSLRTRVARPAGLTERELEVLQLVAAGSSNRRIATTLGLSERTIHRHLSNIFVKLGVASRAEATAYAFQNRLVRLDHG